MPPTARLRPWSSPGRRTGLGGLFIGRIIGGQPYRDYDVGPDGRVLVLRSANEVEVADAGHVIVVHGWLDEVARLVEEGQ